MYVCMYVCVSVYLFMYHILIWWYFQKSVASMEIIGNPPIWVKHGETTWHPTRQNLAKAPNSTATCSSNQHQGAFWSELWRTPRQCYWDSSGGRLTVSQRQLTVSTPWKTEAQLTIADQVAGRGSVGWNHGTELSPPWRQPAMGMVQKPIYMACLGHRWA